MVNSKAEYDHIHIPILLVEQQDTEELNRLEEQEIAKLKEILMTRFVLGTVFS